MPRKMITYSENSTLLWLFVASVVGSSLIVAAVLTGNMLAQIMLFGIGILILAVSIGVFTVAILAPNIANIIRGEEVQPDYELPDDESME